MKQTGKAYYIRHQKSVRGLCSVCVRRSNYYVFRFSLNMKRASFNLYEFDAC